jgi:hypothetical protein
MKLEPLSAFWIVLAIPAAALAQQVTEGLPQNGVAVTFEVDISGDESLVPGLFTVLIEAREISPGEGQRRTAIAMHLHEPKQVVLLPGEYVAHALVYEPRFQGATEFSVPEAQQVSLILERPPRHEIHIKLVNEAGKPVQNLRVTGGLPKDEAVHFEGTTSKQRSVETNAEGIATFEILGDFPTDLHLWVVDPRFERRNISLGAEELTADPIIVKVSELRWNGEIDFYLRLEGEKVPFVEGALGLTNGDSYLAAARLLRTAMPAGEKTYFDFRIKGGKVSLRGLPDGTFVVRRVDLSYREAAFQLFAEMQPRIVIEQGRVVKPKEITLILSADLPELEVSVRDNEGPLGGVFVHLQGLPIPEKKKTDQDGQCRFSVPPGRYEISTRSELHLAKSTIADVTTPRTDVDILLTECPVVNGTVRYGGQPVEGIQVMLNFKAEPPDWVARTAANGEFTAPVRKTGYCTLGFPYMDCLELREYRAEKLAGEEIVIDLKERLQWEVRLTGGQVERAAGKGVIVFVQRGLGQPCSSSAVQSSGTAAVSLLSGEYEPYLVLERDVYALEPVVCEKGSLPEHIEFREGSEAESLNEFTRRMGSRYRKDWSRTGERKNP